MCSTVVATGCSTVVYCPCHAVFLTSTQVNWRSRHGITRQATDQTAVRQETCINKRSSVATKESCTVMTGAQNFLAGTNSAPSLANCQMQLVHLFAKTATAYFKHAFPQSRLQSTPSCQRPVPVDAWENMGTDFSAVPLVECGVSQ